MSWTFIIPRIVSYIMNLVAWKRVLAKVFVLWFEPSFFLQSEYPNNNVYHSALQIAVATCHESLAVVSCFSCYQITRGKANNSAITRSHSSLSNLAHKSTNWVIVSRGFVPFWFIGYFRGKSARLVFKHEIIVSEIKQVSPANEWDFWYKPTGA